MLSVKLSHLSMLIPRVFFKESEQTLTTLPLSPLCVYTLTLTCELYHSICPLSWLLHPYWNGRLRRGVRSYCAWFRNSTFEDHVFKQRIFDQKLTTKTNPFFQTNLVKRSSNEVVRCFRSHLPETWDIMERVSNWLFCE